MTAQDVIVVFYIISLFQLFEQKRSDAVLSRLASQMIGQFIGSRERSSAAPCGPILQVSKAHVRFAPMSSFVTITIVLASEALTTNATAKGFCAFVRSKVRL